jgi:hypothetical protein
MGGWVDGWMGEVVRLFPCLSNSFNALLYVSFAQIIFVFKA